MRHTSVVAAAVVFAAAAVAYGNGGPFIVKYPGGDPAAKGVLARLDPSLMPARETRLKVVKEDLTIAVGVRGFAAKDMPLAGVSAVYTIENPTDEKVEMDFGFPIVRGIYMEPFSMTPRPDVLVQLDGERVNTIVISNSSIYGLIRQQARETIERAIATDAKLAALVKAVPRVVPKPEPLVAPMPKLPHATSDGASPEAKQPAPQPAPTLRDAAVEKPRRDLMAYATETLKWHERDAALLAEYAACDFGQMKHYPPDRWMWGWGRAEDLDRLSRENLGVLAAIGEQRTTQLFAVLAAKFDPKVAAAYETIFQAWGGDVRERSLDLKDGKLRPREIDLEKAKAGLAGRRFNDDPTVYARVDYLDQNTELSDDERMSCRAVLKNLPVVFTFAPMNLLYYRVEFPPKATRVVAVSYKQYCALDTKAPESYQLGYVLHPASLWDTFGPINLKVIAPDGATLRATAALKQEAQRPAPTAQQAATPAKPAGDFSATLDTHAAGPFAVPMPTLPGPADVYTAKLTAAKEKTGELYIAVEKAAFDVKSPTKE